MESTPAILLEQPNNRSTLFAIVEQDERTAWFYIYPSEESGKRYNMRSCWLRNLQPGPAHRDIDALAEGIAPMLEVTACNHPEGKEPLDASLLAVIWTPEDDGATLLYNNEIIAVIPGWSLYLEEPVAYAADCIAPSMDGLVLPMPELTADNALLSKTATSIAFWQQWSDEKQNPWKDIQEQLLSTYEACLGPVQQYFAIDNQQWPPMALARFEKNGIVYFITLGVSIRPMPWVEHLYHEQAADFRRMEIGLAVSTNDFSEDEIMQMATGISSLADLPWRSLSWLGEGHTIHSASVPAPFESFILSSALESGIELTMPAMYEDKINLYWASPITAEEREFAHREPNGGYTLLEKMIEQDITQVVKKRESIAL
ncbi:suppressor of fused domain protein [Deminuibacter soli]|nr:suppressor of fused domain protein [Deminuibacter soli]